MTDHILDHDPTAGVTPVRGGRIVIGVAILGFFLIPMVVNLLQLVR